MTRAELDLLLSAMWQDYLQINPQAQEIHRLFTELNSCVCNDHIALRTFDLPKIDIEQLATPFRKAGYTFAGEYHFPQKKLYARHLQHKDPALPKIFISQLLTRHLSPANRHLIKHLVQQIPAQRLAEADFCYSGRHWPLAWPEYQQLLAESEYAAWIAAFGFRPNHFTILINSLESHHTVAEVNAFLQEKGYQLNTAGGEIKGSPQDLLEQSSTLASPTEVTFTDRTAVIPGCYYEFALRYPTTDGSLYQGFVAASADKIFHSTDSRPGG